jgi:small-conductance mechanosensitive channel
MLRASVKNTGQIDHSFELVVNWCFFVVLAIITVAVLGYDPLALFLSLSSIILAFAFMISSASSKAFEGILLILLRRPFDIGDRIHVSDVNSDTSAGGSASWFVQDVVCIHGKTEATLRSATDLFSLTFLAQDLFTTTVRFATTNEVATLANGSLASSRIINCKRSPKAVRFVYMKFGVK